MGGCRRKRIMGWVGDVEGGVRRGGRRVGWVQESYIVPSCYTYPFGVWLVWGAYIL